MTTELVPDPPLRLEENDLLSLLRPRVLLSLTVITIVFAGICLFTGLAKWMLLGLVGVGAVLAIFSPEHAFALCIFMFAFRNDAFSLGPLKIGDPLYAITAFAWVIHAVRRGKLRWHFAIVIIGLYAVTDVLSGLGAHALGFYAAELIRQMYLVTVFLLALQVMGGRRMLLLCIKAYVAGGLVMALCSYAGLLDKFVLHGSGLPFFGIDVDGTGRFGFCSIAVETERVTSYLVFPMALVAGLQTIAHTRYQRVMSELLFWLGCGACLLSFSRACVIYLVVALGVMWWLTRRHLPKTLLIVGVVGLALLFVTYVPPNSPLVTEFNLQRYALAGQLSQEHQEPRAVVWDTCLRAFESSPVFGIGLDNVLARSMEFRNPWLAFGILQYLGKPPHSAYIGALAETGILGTISLLVMVGYLLQLGRRGVRAAREAGDRTRYVLAAAVVAAFAANVAGGLTFQVFTSNHVWVLMSFLVPLASPTNGVWGPAPSGVVGAEPLSRQDAD